MSERKKWQEAGISNSGRLLPGLQNIRHSDCSFQQIRIQHDKITEM